MPRTLVSSNRAPEEQPAILSHRIRPAAVSAIEALEPRIVFSVNAGAGVASATALNGGQLNEIVNGLEDLGKLGDALEASGVLAQDLEGLGLSFGELFDFGTSDGQGGFLGDAFRDQIATLAAGTTVAQVNTLLGSNPAPATTGSYTDVTWSLVNGGEYATAHPFEWEVTVAGKRTTQNDLVPGTTAAAAGIDFTTAPDVETEATGSFTFSFGLDATNNFFATLGGLSFNVDGTQGSGMTGTIRSTEGASH